MPALREALRFARRHGYNLRYALVVGGGEPVAEVLRVLNRRRDVGIFVLGLLSDKKEVPDNVRWLGGIEDVRAAPDGPPRDHLEVPGGVGALVPQHGNGVSRSRDFAYTSQVLDCEVKEVTNWQGQRQR